MKAEDRERGRESVRACARAFACERNGEIGRKIREQEFKIPALGGGAHARRRSLSLDAESD